MEQKLTFCNILKCSSVLAFRVFSVNNLFILSLAPCTSQPLGMEDGTIAKNQITSSGHINPNLRPKYARLNLPSDVSSGQSIGSYGGWCVKGSDEEKWIQVAFNAPVSLAGVMMQARDVYQTYEFWVSRYQVQYSDDGDTWHNMTYAEQQEPMVSISIDFKSLW